MRIREDMVKANRLKGENIYLKPLDYQDALKIRQWGSHENKLFIDYNLSDLTETQIHFWYSTKKKNFRKSYFAIYNNEDRMIGYMGVKDINLFKKESFLGIVLDPNFLEMGYGTESIRVFLRYYFYEMKMKKILLDVNAFNTRAIRAYEKLGFLYITEYLGEFENQEIDFKDPYYEPYEKYFTYHRGVLLSQIHIMEMDLRRFEMRL